jgi:hypothetical protein
MVNNCPANSLAWLLHRLNSNKRLIGLALDTKRYVNPPSIEEKTENLKRKNPARGLGS